MVQFSVARRFVAFSSGGRNTESAAAGEECATDKNARSKRRGPDEGRDDDDDGDDYDNAGSQEGNATTHPSSSQGEDSTATLVVLLMEDAASSGNSTEDPKAPSIAKTCAADIGSPAITCIHAVQVDEATCHIVVGTSDKQVKYFIASLHGEDMSTILVNEKAVEKKPTNVLITEDSILVADKFGDVYRFNRDFSSDGSKDLPLCGHISILTSFSRLGSRLVTADRDGKIRISRYPKAFCVEAYCLGHLEFVSALDISQDVIVSGSGDGTVRLWNFTGSEIGKIKTQSEHKSTMDTRGDDDGGDDDGGDKRLAEDDTQDENAPTATASTTTAVQRSSTTVEDNVPAEVADASRAHALSAEEQSKLKQRSVRTQFSLNETPAFVAVVENTLYYTLVNGNAVYAAPIVDGGLSADAGARECARVEGVIKGAALCKLSKKLWLCVEGKAGVVFVTMSLASPPSPETMVLGGGVSLPYPITSAEVSMADLFHHNQDQTVDYFEKKSKRLEGKRRADASTDVQQRKVTKSS